MRKINKIKDLIVGDLSLAYGESINFLNTDDGIENLKNKYPRGRLVNINADLPSNWRSVTIQFLGELNVFLELRRDDA